MNFKGHILTFFAVTFLLMFTYSFIDVDWRTDTLNYIKFYIAPFGVLVIMQFIRRSNPALKGKGLIIIIPAIIFSFTVNIWLTGK